VIHRQEDLKDGQPVRINKGGRGDVLGCCM
jgi:hypothetical protein